MSRTPKGVRWVCPKCDAWVITHLPLTADPVCVKHAGGYTKMTQQKGNDNE